MGRARVVLIATDKSIVAIVKARPQGPRLQLSGALVHAMRLRWRNAHEGDVSGPHW
jgi:hypothetical protein